MIKTESNDNRSYHVCSEKIKNILNFETKYTVKDAVADLKMHLKKLLTNTFKNKLFLTLKQWNLLNYNES